MESYKEAEGILNENPMGSPRKSKELELYIHLRTTQGVWLLRGLKSGTPVYSKTQTLVRQTLDGFLPS